MDTNSYEALVELLPQRICGLAVDIDGTITERRQRGDFRLSLEAVEALRALEDAGIRVMLVTGNSVMVTAGVARYIGVKGPHVSENGCLVYRRGSFTSACRGTARAAARVLEEEMSGIIEPSWQNRCRFHDYAFTVRRGSVEEVIQEAEKLLRERGHQVKLSHSGYAIHVRPLEASKGLGLSLALRYAGLNPDCVIAIGDSVIDLEMREAGVLLAAVGNADPLLRKRADIVVPGESGKSVALLAKIIVEKYK
ncbi:Phosphoglycolate phosphatase, archaeal type [Pyrodictium delaneyi]|uniref:Phosphoglycolate phosphatase n=1 Tax=Pyrodictium delaneyi TaxID=1273541 RepID=A0A0P0N3P8_9CREN|nr:phosphoglycolate phosphatase [Pyrodictium delaneyi]ALL01551.1 Phosphoglycolate phosphatase, archaeal type [Pyrodictium delaneyi]OWJ54549.1 phosphoglycolate phosphatase [Pyrodictium delaneyi]